MAQPILWVLDKTICVSKQYYYSSLLLFGTASVAEMTHFKITLDADTEYEDNA